MSEQHKSRAEIRYKNLYLTLIIALAIISAIILYIDPATNSTSNANKKPQTTASQPTPIKSQPKKSITAPKPIKVNNQTIPKKTQTVTKPKNTTPVSATESDIQYVEKNGLNNDELLPDSASKRISDHKTPKKQLNLINIKTPTTPPKKTTSQLPLVQSKIKQKKNQAEIIKTTSKPKIADSTPSKAKPQNQNITKKKAKKAKTLKTKKRLSGNVIPKIIEAKTPPLKPSSTVRVTSLSSTETTPEKESPNQIATNTKPTVPAQVSDDFIETAFDLFVGGNYFGFVMLKYNDNWIELFDPQEAIALLPLIRNRQVMLPLFEGRIVKAREVAEVGSLQVDYNNFAINVTIAPEQALEVKVSKKKSAELEGSPTFLMRVGAKGNKPFDVENDSSRFTITNNTRFAYNQYRFQTSGTLNDFDNEYQLDTFQGEADFTLFEAPLTMAGGLIDVPGQMFASSLNIYGLSLESNHRLYANDPLLSSNELEVFVPTRSLVEIYKNNSETGVVLYSRMHDFGHTQIDTRKFPRGSYPVVIVVSVDGIERARYTEQFFKYEEILPRETIDLNISAGKLRNNLKELGLPVFFGSLRTRLRYDLEGSFSFYSIDDRNILSQSLKKIFDTENLGEFTITFTLSESNSKSLLGYAADIRWRGKTTSASLYYTKSFEDEPVYYQDQEVLLFKERDAINLNISRNLTVWDRSLNISFKGQYRDNQDTGVSYRYGPLFRFTPYRSRSTSLILTAQHDWTNTGEQTRIQASLTYRFSPVTVGSLYNSAHTPTQTTTNWQHYIQYHSNKTSPGKLKNLNAKALYNANKTSLQNGNQIETTIYNLNAFYEGSTVQSGVYLNKSSGGQGGFVGGEILSTFIAGSNDLMQMAGSVPIGSGIIAISLMGDIAEDKLISVLINGNHKAYINTGEVAFIEAPVYKTSKIEIRDANPKDGDFIKIVNPFTDVTPYPGNIVHRSFDIAKLAIISGTLSKENGEPVSNKFFETGYEPAYTDSDGGFIVEMPIRSSEKQFDFIARDHLCTFEIPKVPKDSLVEVGNVQCKLANADELRLIRTIHDETRIYD